MIMEKIERSTGTSVAPLLAQAPAATDAHGGGEAKHALHVRVVHGDFRLGVEFPLVFGHYEDDTLVDVEADIDRWLERRLSQRHRLGAYPGPLGTAEVVQVPGRAERVVLVVGLGLVGHLTADTLADAVTRAVLRYVAEAQDRGSLTPAQADVGLSFLLIGSNSPGVSVEDSVLGITRGVLAANRTLRPLRQESRPQDLEIARIDFIELYENRAEAAARAAGDLLSRLGLQLENDERLWVAPHVVSGKGGQTSTPTVSGNLTWWRRILVRDNGAEGLHYLTLSDSARADGAFVALHRANAEHYVASLTGKTAHDDDAAATLFHMLLPNSLKPRLSTERDVVLVFERAEGVSWSGRGGAATPLPPTHYPWELIAERRGEDVLPLALRVGLVRQLRADDTRPVVPPRGRHVLVIGNPQTDGLHDLPGAAAEADAVTERLRHHGFSVESRIKAAGGDVLEALFRREWLALHIAGHGGYVPGDRGRSGVRLSDGMRLTAGEIEQLPVVPSLVFLNCCHVGTLDPANHPGVAASVAEQLIRRGVRAVVAAGWAVNDLAARTFAETFYDEMGRGVPFGTALKCARVRTHEMHPDVNTWGAYQAYGDPGFVLRLRDENGHAACENEPLSRREFRLRLVAFRDAPPADSDEARARLERLLSRAASDWHDDPVVRELEGDAWRQVGEFERSVEAYRAAVAARSGDVSLRALLRLSNLEVRRAVQIAGAAAAQQIRDALARIERVLELQPSSEAWAMKGSALKRLAVVGPPASLPAGATVRSVLSAAADAYAAAECAAGADAYAALNRLLLQWLLGQTDARATQDKIEEIERAARERRPKHPLFFDRVVPADARLVRWLARGAPAGEAAAVAECYLAARADAPEGDFLSVIDHVEWLVQACRALDGHAPHPDARDPGKRAPRAVDRLHAALHALAERSWSPRQEGRKAPPPRPRRAE